MTLIAKYGAAALVLLLILAASYYSAYQWGYNVAEKKQLLNINEALAKSAKHIIDEQAKLQSIEDVITKDTDGTVIKSPVLMRTLTRLSDCAGKDQC